MPKNPTTGKRREATIVERVKVIEKHAAGKSYRAIGEDIGISKSEAQRIIQRWKDFEELRPRPRTGRPSKYPPGETRAERRKKYRLEKKLADAEKATTGLAEIVGEAGSSANAGESNIQVAIVSPPVNGQDLPDDVPGSVIRNSEEETREHESENGSESSGGEDSDEAEDGATNPQVESEQITNQNSPTESAQ
ncbi:hypothetical protein L873DRAFT_1464438 [Choiromyces venosus 120613-1]|uniref:Insertion element IS150 protein InsJ-like helix-turn-helix domain-containing protein n=1 Tax=Choiromyces venosus 120613-1 TaxID=1336337 RepID=A0A3N4K0Z3_9PEZI|nr:hypothetical protein L873DRAFT_1464438 [Choiromyces venosus 120613-1]